jgi:hypothetical protein
MWTTSLHVGVVGVGAMLICVLLHVAVLELIIRLSVRCRSGLWTLLGGVPLLMVTHVLQVGVFAVGIELLYLWHGDELGELTGAFERDALSLWYFSASVFTTVGFGDITPVGPIRILVGLEAIAGLVLITWSASFTFLGMQRTWKDRRQVAADDGP